MSSCVNIVFVVKLIKTQCFPVNIQACEKQFLQEILICVLKTDYTKNNLSLANVSFCMRTIQHIRKCKVLPERWPGQDFDRLVIFRFVRVASVLNGLNRKNKQLSHYWILASLLKLMLNLRNWRWYSWPQKWFLNQCYQCIRILK